jgi:hypothetical protein
MRSAVLGAVFLVLIPASGLARDLFTTEIEVDGQFASTGTNSLTAVGDLFDDQALEALFGASYDPLVSAVSASLDLRGVETRVSYEAGSPNFRFEVPTAGIDLIFDGATRDQSEAAFEDWIRGESDPSADYEQALTKLLQAFMAFSPVDPVAGNPNSLESRMFQGDFGLGSLGPFLGDFPDPSERIPALWKLDLEFGHFGAGAYEGESYEVDLAFGWTPSRRLAIVVNLDGMIALNEGEALTGLGTLGLGLTGRISDAWNLSLVGRMGLVGSVDVGAVAALYSVSLVNHMRFDLEGWRIEMSNMVGVANSIEGIEIDGTELDYDLTNVVLKNGFSFSREISRGQGARPLRARLFLTDTQYFVDDLWLEHVDEVGLGIGLGSRGGVRTYDPVALDVSYVFGTDYDALRLRLSLRY